MKPTEPNRIRAAAHALAAAFALLLAAAPAAAQTEVTLVSNNATTVDGQSNFGDDQAQAFTTGSAAGGYRLTGVGIAFATVGGSPSYSVQIRRDSDGEPGASVATLSKPSSLAVGQNRFTASGIDLAADTTYWVVVDSTREETGTSVRHTSEDREDTAYPGWDVADTHLSRDWPASEWNSVARTTAMRMRVYGWPKDTTAPAFSKASVNGTELAVTFSRHVASGRDSMNHDASRIGRSALGGPESRCGIPGRPHGFGTEAVPWPANRPNAWIRNRRT